MGSYITQALLKTNKHKITAVTRARADSSSKFPEGVIVKEVNYDDQPSLVEALEGQHVLVILMSVTVPPNTQDKLIRAAAEAGVPWVLPSEWAGDPKEVELGKGIFVGPQKQATRDLIDSIGKSSWIGMVASFWYEFSLAGSPTRFGFDFFNRAVTFYGEGTEVINVSTYGQCARAVANLLSLKILPENENDKSPTLSQFKNNFVYLSSFAISQKDMFDSVLRVTGTTEKDWKINYQDCKERYDKGIAKLQNGDRDGFEQAMYVRIFFPVVKEIMRRKDYYITISWGCPRRT